MSHYERHCERTKKGHNIVNDSFAHEPDGLLFVKGIKCLTFFDCARRYCTRCGSSGSYIRSTRRRAGRNNTSSPEPWPQGILFNTYSIPSCVASSLFCFISKGDSNVQEEN